MDILKILTESSDSLIPEDLDFFVTELETGNYDASYIQQCKDQIEILRNWHKGNVGAAQPKKNADKIGTPKGVVMTPSQLAPQQMNPAAQLPPEELVRGDLKRLRVQNDYKSAFKTYVKGSSIIDAAFVDANYGLFAAWEINAIISVKQMGEAFLEKYFGALDLEKIARYQQFSENFFMKHFSQLDAQIVLERGKNEWRRKENRSKQLDVFLRLKGVKI